MVLVEAANMNGCTHTGGKTTKVLHASKDPSIPLLINGISVFDKTGARQQALPDGGYFQGATISDCHEAIRSSSTAFKEWSQTSPFRRRQLLLSLAEVSMRPENPYKYELYITRTFHRMFNSREVLSSRSYRKRSPAPRNGVISI